MRMKIEIPFGVRKLQQLWKLVRESHAEPLAGSQTKPPEVGAGETAITFIGHSSFLLQTAGRAVLVDPVFATRLIVLRRQRLPGLRIADLPQIDAVLLTHAHMDHLNRPSLRATTREMRRRGFASPVAIVPQGVEDLVEDLGFAQVETLGWWESTELNGAKEQGARLKITATPARHWGARMFKDMHRGFGGYVIESSRGPAIYHSGDTAYFGGYVIESSRGPAIYHSGDTAYFGGFAEIGRRLRPEIALLPIGAYFPDSYRAVHTSPEEALQGFLDLKADVMIPMHFGTFRLGREPMEEPLPRLLRAAERAGVGERVVALGEGESWKRGGADQPERRGRTADSGAKARDFSLGYSGA